MDYFVTANFSASIQTFSCMRGRRNRKKESGYQDEILKIQLDIQERSLQLIRDEAFEQIGQALIVAKQKLQVVSAAKQEKADEIITASVVEIDSAMRDLRLFTRPVRLNEIEQQGFIYALQKEVEIINGMDTCQAELIWNKNFPRLDVSKELVLFGITQELVSIVLHSSSKKEVLINAGYSDAAIKLSIKNRHYSGERISYPDKTTAAFASCSQKMDIRARLLYAVITTTHVADEGIEVLIQLPLSINPRRI
jgi:glucose-6-phosphate-specific signal transduction histidine kinase